MDSFEFNKIAAAILVVALLLIGLNQIGDSVYRVKKPETPGYKIEGVAETKAPVKGEAKKEEKLADIKILLATANVAAGENTFSTNIFNNFCNFFICCCDINFTNFTIDCSLPTMNNHGFIIN